MKRQSPAELCVILILNLMVWTGWCSPVTATETDVQLEYLTRMIPKRPSHALTGSQFVDLVATMDECQREAAISTQLLEGNVPEFIRKLKPVTLRKTTRDGQLASATIFVTPDYLSIGSKDDFIRMPMNYSTAKKVANQFGFILPTRRMVDAIYSQSQSHFIPQPLQPGPEMCSTGYYQRHNQMIRQQRWARGIALGDLVSGDKKDVVITNRLHQKKGRIAIYGWHRPDGKPIQPLSTVHGADYADYSHGIRLVSDKVLIDGAFRSIFDVLEDPETASLLSDEGPIVGFNPRAERAVLVAN